MGYANELMHMHGKGTNPGTGSQTSCRNWEQGRARMQGSDQQHSHPHQLLCFKCYIRILGTTERMCHKAAEQYSPERRMGPEQPQLQLHFPIKLFIFGLLVCFQPQVFWNSNFH